MEFLIIVGISLIITIILKFIFDYSMKKIKKLAQMPELDEIANKYPENIDICKYYLKKLNNEKVKIEEDEKATNSLYIAVSDKIIIANIKNSYSRIQTIAHECLHSVQDRKLLMFNFIFSNVYLAYFLVVCVLVIFKMLPYKLLFLSILIILSMVYILVRNFLETDAMTKAEYLAKDYMNEIKISSKEEIDKLANGFKLINSIGIKATNYNLFLGTMVKIIIFCVLCFFL